MHVKVKDLPACVRAALASVGYDKADIAVRATEKCSIQVCGGEGRKGFAILLDLVSGKYDTRWGSWGGANMFNPDNPVDLDGNTYTIPQNGVVITGTVGHHYHASIDMRPENVQPMLPAAPAELSPMEQRVLNIIGGYTSAGRKDEFARWTRDAGYAADPHFRDRAAREAAERATAEEIASAIDALVSRGMCARNRVGAVAITTEGKNARKR